MEKTAPKTVHAVISLAGHQYLVSSGDTIKTDKVIADKDNKVIVSDVFLVHDGEKTLIGQPLVENASVTLRLKATAKGEKLRIAKFKAKSRYRRVTGHRQLVSELVVEDISYK